jgi:hypothetical protein
VHTKTARKEQPTIRLRQMSGGSDSCRRQLRSRFAKAEGKFIAKRWQYKEDQFRAMRDQIEDLTTQLSNLRGHKGSGSRNPCTERQTQGYQHLVQAPINQWVSNSTRNSNLKNFWIGCWLLKRFLSSTECPMNDESLWWYTHSGKKLLCDGNN